MNGHPRQGMAWSGCCGHRTAQWAGTHALCHTTVAVFKGPSRTELLPGASESARSHDPAGGGRQQTELGTEARNHLKYSCPI